MVVTRAQARAAASEGTDNNNEMPPGKGKLDKASINCQRIDDLETLRLEIFKSPEWFERIAEYGDPFLVGRDVTAYISVGKVSSWRYLALVMPNFKAKYPRAFPGLLLEALKGTFSEKAFSVEFEDIQLRLNIDQFLVEGNRTILQHCNLTGQTWGSESVQFMPSIRLIGDQILQRETIVTRDHLYSYLGKSKLILCDNQEANNEIRAKILADAPWLKEIALCQDKLYQDSSIKLSRPADLRGTSRLKRKKPEGKKVKWYDCQESFAAEPEN